MELGAAAADAVRWRRIERATAQLDPPFAVIDLPAFDANARDLVRRAAGTPVRLASKSVRCFGLIERALGVRGFRGVLAYSAREAIELVRGGVSDVLIAYPSVDQGALGEIGDDSELSGRITFMVDDAAHLRLLARYVDGARVCLDIDASLAVGPVRLGVRRSPIRTPTQAAVLAQHAQAVGLGVRGVMFYEAQVAGMPDTPALRLVKAASLRQLRERRGAVARAVELAVGRLDLVNGGGTGSIEQTRADPVITEVAAGSGLFGPALFDHYRSFTPAPALVVALPVSRRPAPGIVTAFSGGYVASGAPGWSRLPQPAWPGGLRYLRQEGAGEVQTPLRGPAAARLQIGDRVWVRPAKAGEICERFDRLFCVAAEGSLSEVVTYRGAGWAFG